MKEIIATASGVEEAIDKACAQLGIDRADAQWEIISLPKKGILGFGKSDAKVRVYVEEELDVQALVKEAIASTEEEEKPAPAPRKKTERKPAPEKREKAKEAEPAPLPEAPWLEAALPA